MLDRAIEAADSHGSGALSVKTVESVPDLKPFAAEPLFLARLHGRNVSPLAVGFLTAFIMLVAVSWSALIENSFYRQPSKKSVTSDIWLFLSRAPSGSDSTQSMPYLRDYPSLVLTVTIALAVPLVYGLFRSLSVLHKQLERAQCIRYDDAGRQRLVVAINEMNSRLARHGKFARLTFSVIAFGVTWLNFKLEHQLFPFFGGDLYETWWARVIPFRVGGLIWIAFGSIGAYLVYVEIIVGVGYVRFLRRCRVDYQFGANPLNPDGFYGWSILRQVISNGEAGLVCSAASTFAMYYFVQPVIGTIAAFVVLSAFMGIGLYVNVSTILNLRRQVKKDRKDQIREVLDSMPTGAEANSVTGHIATLVAHRRLEAIAKIPSMPIRQGVVIASIVSTVAPLIAIVGELLKYLAPT